MPDARRLMIDTAVMAGIALLVALLGPFGTYAIPFAVRLLYWAALAFGGYWIYLPAMVAASRLAERLDLPRAALWAAACLIATVPMSVLVWCVNAAWEPLYWPGAGEALAHYLNVLVMGGLVCAIFWFGEQRRAAAIPAPAATPAPPEPAFLDRLPPHLGRTLLALEMEDHYVRAHTPAGSALILMRMRDAAAELAGIEGTQVHRSWWVARAAVSGSRRDGRNFRLLLSNGIEAPVARDKAAELRAAGWL